MGEINETNGAGAQAENTWTGFKAMMTWGTVGAALIGALVVFLIAPK
jgi:hypothetical protein